MIALINGLGHSDQRIILVHMLELSPNEKHLPTELIDCGYFKWDFFAAPMSGPAQPSKSSPSPSPPSLSSLSSSSSSACSASDFWVTQSHRPHH